MSLKILNDLIMKILEKETKSNIKNPLHTKDLLKFKIIGRDGSQWFLIRNRCDSIYLDLARGKSFKRFKTY